MSTSPAAPPIGTVEELFPPALLARLERLQLSTRRRLAGKFSGEHRSPRYGSSLDFADYREYHPGDDYRRIDYSLYARTDQLFLRLFEAEDDLAVRVVVDTSASMGFHGKLRQAARLCGALGFIALGRRDIVSLLTFPTPPGGSPWRRFNGHGAIEPYLRICSRLQAGGLTDIDGAVGDVLARPGPAGATVMISDLLSPGWERTIDRLPARGGDTTIVHVLATEEIHPVLVGDLDVQDAESGQTVSISMSPELANKFEIATGRWLDGVQARCASRGVRYLRVMADDDLESLMLTGWRNEGILR